MSAPKFDQARHEAAVAECDLLRVKAQQEYTADVAYAARKLQRELLNIEGLYALRMGLE